jgi:hypothetical protein
MHYGLLMEEEMTLFTLRVRVSNVWSHIKRAEHGHVIYETLYKYRIRFPDHTRYLMKHDVRLVDRPLPPRALSFGSAPAAAPVEDASVVPSDLTSGGGEYGSEGFIREPSVSSGQGSVLRIVLRIVLRSVHTSAVHTLGAAMTARPSVANRSSMASPASVASQPPLAYCGRDG